MRIDNCKTIEEKQNFLIEEFSQIEDWMDKYALIIEYGNSLSPLDPKYKTNNNLIEGCQSNVWIYISIIEGKVVLKADSGSAIVKGIVSLIINVLSGYSPKEIISSDLYFIDKIGLKEHLSPNRSNGIPKILDKIYKICLDEN